MAEKKTYDKGYNTISNANQELKQNRKRAVARRLKI